MEVLAVALVLFLPAGVAAHRLATGRRFPTLSWCIVAAGAGQVLLPAAVFGLFAAGVQPPSAGRYLAGFFEVALVATASFALMWGLSVALVVLYWVRRSPDAEPGAAADGPRR